MILWSASPGTPLRDLSELVRRLAGLDLAPVQTNALARESDALRQAVRDVLTDPPGGDHSVPWLRTGALRDSIAAQADTEGAAVGSDDPVAVFQELGTDAIPPRPFLASTAARTAPALTERIAGSVFDAVRDALK